MTEVTPIAIITAGDTEKKCVVTPLLLDMAKGDVIKCAADVEHWHGALQNSGFTYIAVTPTQKGKTVWLEPVSEQAYKDLKIE